MIFVPLWRKQKSDIEKISGTKKTHCFIILSLDIVLFLMQIIGSVYVFFPSEGVRNISNQLTITTKFDLSSANLVEKATAAGLYKPEDGEFNFAKVFDEDGFRSLSSRYCAGKSLLEQFSQKGILSFSSLD